MRISSSCAWLIVAGLTFMVLPTAARPVPTELKTVHILVVFDDDDKELRGSLRVDQWRMGGFIRANFPQGRRTWALLSGARATRDNILKYYRNLRTSPTEGLFFFYGGHGATNARKQHFFAFTHGPPLYRKDLRHTMEAKKAGLVVILTDCCSNMVTVAPARDGSVRAAPRGPTAFSPTIRQLFYLSRGTVDVTAASNDEAWGDSQQGGLFTSAVCRLLERPLRDLDTNHNGVLTWHEFFPQLQTATRHDFDTWSARMRRMGEKEIAFVAPQKPTAYSLGTRTSGAGDGEHHQAYAVAGIENATGRQINYEYRWSARGPWKKVHLSPGKKKTHVVPLQANGTPPLLYARFDGIRKVQTLPAQRTGGARLPSYADGTQYRIRPRK